MKERVNNSSYHIGAEQTTCLVAINKRNSNVSIPDLLDSNMFQGIISFSNIFQILSANDGPESLK